MVSSLVTRKCYTRVAPPTNSILGRSGRDATGFKALANRHSQTMLATGKRLDDEMAQIGPNICNPSQGDETFVIANCHQRVDGFR